MENENIDKLKFILRENEIPFFSDDELSTILANNGNNINKAAYQCLLIKALDTSLQISGLTTQDTSKYFLRLARLYKANNSGVLPYE